MTVDVWMWTCPECEYRQGRSVPEVGEVVECQKCDFAEEVADIEVSG